MKLSLALFDDWRWWYCRSLPLKVYGVAFCSIVLYNQININFEFATLYQY